MRQAEGGKRHGGECKLVFHLILLMVVPGLEPGFPFVSKHVDEP